MKHIFYIYGFIILLSSCVVYHPQSTDIPLISKQNDLRVDAGVSILTTAYSTVSYGLTDKHAVQTFGSLGSDERFYIQGAFGKYKTLENNKVLELYFGAGYGYGESYSSVNPDKLSGYYKTIFSQLNYGKLNGNFANLDFGIGLKLGYLHANLTNREYSFSDQEVLLSKYSTNNLLFEPNAMVRLGGEKLKFSLKAGGCIIHDFNNLNKSILYHYINIGFGIHFHL